ncbi:hypothetical protein Bateq7PJ16_0859 [Bacillus subtilis]|nr:hypothetical protein Bateq7PJ16_0859 [Bacillus subtilis]
MFTPLSFIKHAASACIIHPFDYKGGSGMLKGIGKKKKNCVPGEVLRYYGVDFRN